MTTWHKGPPPSIGWWPASVTRDHAVLRWWNGQWWSDPAWPYTPAKVAAAAARRQRWLEDEIEWTDRPAWWPERSKT
jgi:hypothetical protein